MSLSQDLRAAARQLARKPLANGAAAATLTLGIGSSVALFVRTDLALVESAAPRRGALLCSVTPGYLAAAGL